MTWVYKIYLPLLHVTDKRPREKERGGGRAEELLMQLRVLAEHQLSKYILGFYIDKEVLSNKF